MLDLRSSSPSVFGLNTWELFFQSPLSSVKQQNEDHSGTVSEFAQTTMSSTVVEALDSLESNSESNEVDER